MSCIKKTYFSRSRAWQHALYYYRTLFTLTTAYRCHNGRKPGRRGHYHLTSQMVSDKAIHIPEDIVKDFEHVSCKWDEHQAKVGLIGKLV